MFPLAFKWMPNIPSENNKSQNAILFLVDWFENDNATNFQESSFTKLTRSTYTFPMKHWHRPESTFIGQRSNSSNHQLLHWGIQWKLTEGQIKWNKSCWCRNPQVQSRSSTSSFLLWFWIHRRIQRWWKKTKKYTIKGDPRVESFQKDTILIFLLRIRIRFCENLIKE